jgi:hypothetical protein
MSRSALAVALTRFVNPTQKPRRIRAVGGVSFDGDASIVLDFKPSRISVE